MLVSKIPALKCPQCKSTLDITIKAFVKVRVYEGKPLLDNYITEGEYDPGHYCRCSCGFTSIIAEFQHAAVLAKTNENIQMGDALLRLA